MSEPRHDAMLEIPSAGQADLAVLAVLVVYGRTLNEVAAWPRLQSWLLDAETAHSDPSRSPAFRLQHLLIYDNSATLLSRPPVHDAITVQHDARNGGTRAAYLHALGVARALKLPWVLLLDHDTALPIDFFERLNVASANALGVPCVAWLPVVESQSRPISPAMVQSTGSVRPINRTEGPWHGKSPLTGVASGSLVAVNAMLACQPPPADMWLDGVDHWYFLQLQRRGGRIGTFGALLTHDLSIHDLSSLSARRASSIMASLRGLLSVLPWPAKLVYPLRALWFMTRLCRRSPRMALDVTRLWLTDRGQHD